jgi:hypothetical protein
VNSCEQFFIEIYSNGITLGENPPLTATTVFNGEKPGTDGRGINAMSALAAKTLDVCRLVMVYEDELAREEAAALVNRLEHQVGSGLGFVFNSWNFKDLAEPVSARAATSAAANADIILLSAHGNDLPSAVGRWLDLCSVERTSSEGALVLYLTEPFMLSAASEAVITRLQQAAGLLGMDFLSLIPQPAEQIIQSFKERTGGHTFLPPEFHERSSDEHWGLNE